jgi:tRNA 5-methylaminomethyl-2-thiouridine biosynthesis bifunctional protein
LQNTKIIWDDGVPKSAIYDDIYFCRENGLAEAGYVFLQGNDLPGRWSKTSGDFHIIETGFGAGLNFFASWKLWNEHAEDAKLYYTSIEKHPLKIEDIRRAIATWPQFDSYLDEFSRQYPQSFEYPAKILLSNNKVQLTILYQDVRDALGIISNKADAWFLDGFSPAKNPDMWQEALYFNMSRLTNSKGSFATFTASGNVRRGLQRHGFNAHKISGFGKKRHILVGNFVAGISS